MKLSLFLHRSFFVVCPYLVASACNQQEVRYVGGFGGSGGGTSGDGGHATSTLSCASSAPPLHDGGVDASIVDGGHDAGTGADAGHDGGPCDAGFDGGIDAGLDAGNDGGFSSTCSPSAVWLAGLPVPIPTLTTDGGAPVAGRFGGITLDLMTAAWVTGSEGSASVLIADRTEPNATFAAPVQLPASTSGAALDRVAITPDGLRVGVLQKDRRGFVEYVRSTRDGVFAQVGAGLYGNVNSYASGLPTGRLLSDPMIAGDGLTLYYSFYDATSGDAGAQPSVDGGGSPSDGGSLDGGVPVFTIYTAARLLPTDAWNKAGPYQVPDVTLQPPARARLSGISADQLTLFYWEEGSGVERAAFRRWHLGDFEYSVDVGAMPFAAPNTACDALYYMTAPLSASALNPAPP